MFSCKTNIESCQISSCCSYDPFTHCVHAHLRYAGGGGDSLDECLDEHGYLLSRGSCRVCISVVWVNFWATVWANLQNGQNITSEGVPTFPITSLRHSCSDAK